MNEDSIGLSVGGQFNIIYINYNDPSEYTDGADNEERVNKMLERFVYDS